MVQVTVKILARAVLAGLMALPVAAEQTALEAKGEKIFRKCKACHAVGSSAKNKTGPVLTGVVGAPAGQVTRYAYSKAMRNAGAGGLVWTPDKLSEFLAWPDGYIKGTNMKFRGLRKPAEIDAVIAYLAATGARDAR